MLYQFIQGNTISQFKYVLITQIQRYCLHEQIRIHESTRGGNVTQFAVRLFTRLGVAVIKVIVLRRFKTFCTCGVI